MKNKQKYLKVTFNGCTRYSKREPNFYTYEVYFDTLGLVLYIHKDVLILLAVKDKKLNPVKPSKKQLASFKAEYVYEIV
nr:MAG TPA: hypothetical protein [Caudoviricetes sp.]